MGFVFTKISRILNIDRSQAYLLVLSFSFIFFVFTSYSMLRPVRDALGAVSGELKNLFLYTFIASIIASFIAMYLSSKIKKKYYITIIYGFFISNLVIFFIVFYFFKDFKDVISIAAQVFFVWTSVFNIFALSSAWSVLSDVFNKQSSKKLFSIIAAGASAGGILGALVVGALVSLVSFSYMFLFSTALLFIATILQVFILLEVIKNLGSSSSFESPIKAKSLAIIEGVSLIFKSKYLLLITLFILLITSVSTFLYMEQARIVNLYFTSTEDKTRVFAIIDLAVQISSLVIQVFFTGAILKRFGMKFLLSFLPIVVGILFIILSFTHPLLIPFIIAMVIRRVGEYALIKPGREMSFVPLSDAEKYKAKNFLDTVVYRGGDALSAQVEHLVLMQGVTYALLFGGFLSFLWGFVGFKIAKTYEKL